MTEQLSPDGNWWWDGTRWVSAISADGRWRWDGERWLVNEARLRPLGPTEFEPTRDTRRLQVVLTLLCVLALGIGIATSIYSATHLSELVDLTPYQDPQVFQSTFQVGIVLAIVFSAALYGVMVAGAWLRWRWVYYATMIFAVVVLVFGTIGIAANLAGLSSVRTPGWETAASVLQELAFLGVALWMFVLWRRYRTAWATRAIPA